MLRSIVLGQILIYENWSIIVLYADVTYKMITSKEGDNKTFLP